MADDKMVVLAKKLLSRTKEGKLHWEMTSHDDVYQVAFANYVVRLLSRAGSEGPEIDYIMQILNERGQLVDEVSDVDLTRLMASGETMFPAMRDLYDLARRTAMGVEQALTTLLDELDG